jgi:photosystem II stability/assembly factor-like uncharacterized protein
MVIHSGDGSAVLSRTDDGGSNWQPQLPLQYPKLFQRNMSFVNSEVGFVVVGTYLGDKVQPRLFATSNGGKQWIARSLPSGGAVAGIDFVSSSNGWVLEQTPLMANALFTTRDGGNTWNECVDPKTGIAMSNINKTDHLEGVRFQDARHGWIAGWETGKSAGAALYYYTADGCATWQKIPLVRAQQRLGAESVYFVDPPQVNAQGETGVVVTARGNPPGFRTSVFEKKTTGWSEVEVRNSVDLRPAKSPVSALPTATNGVQFLGGTTGFAEATDRAGSAELLRTLDSGTSWSTVRLNGMEPTPFATTNGMKPTAFATANRLPMAVDESCCIPPCSDEGCNNVDPQSSGCSAGPPAAYTVSTVDPNYWNPYTGTPYTYTDELRYESWCGANWGRTYSNIPSDPGCSSGCFSGVELDSTLSGRYSTSSPYGIGFGTTDYSWPPPTHWTVMLSGSSSQDRVCRPDGSGICTGWG